MTAKSPLQLPAVPERLSIREHVAHALRAALIAGRLRPGTVYSAPQLAADFGVSATPVREAMLDLVREGMVEPVRNKGFRVTELSRRDLADYLAVRELIEVPTVGEIARSADLSALEELRPVARRIVTAARRGDLVAFLEADRRFHLGLLQLGRNRRLVEVVGDLRGHSRLYGLSRLAESGQLMESAQEHERLLDLVSARDAEAAEGCMRGHLRRLRTQWEEPGEPEGPAPPPG
ncbi:MULTISPECIES: GntR family transcriptional regulator [Streptomyces]|uniref:GntR family transcriptional regulator n=1 Tax=Streptomyces cacaoi TaxID=1898 RepID=A0A4Y3R2R6_STRCI|nr:MULTISPECIES: GntR family transcriptional regulator [Streptomyces]NNG89686.1 GntR family transcriptional regulator [Streptomyces cacaoi]QHF97856.1 GntR family transcriptional regulator [Streptomyces sp. NHF165]GEB52026.1 GntR family transcriptional regulator [Streptomyces cacaoi]